MRNYQAKTVDDYIDLAPAAAQPKLKEMRAVIKAAVPKADEGISWGIPFYKYQGLLAGFSAFQRHISFGFMALLSATDRQTLAEQGYTTGKKTVQIRFDQPVPAAVIQQILQAQARVNESKFAQNKV